MRSLREPGLFLNYPATSRPSKCAANCFSHGYSHAAFFCEFGIKIVASILLLREFKVIAEVNAKSETHVVTSESA